MYWILKKYGAKFASFALAVSQIMAINGCRYFLNQPKIPEKLLIMKK